MRYAHTNIVTNDWRKLSAFYVKVFDCQILPPERNQSGDWLSQGTGVKDASLQGVHLLLPGHGNEGPTLEIYQYSNVEQQEMISANRRGIGHLAFEVEDVKKVLDEILENGGMTSGEITTKRIDAVGEITFVYARDPEGNLIELQKWVKNQLQ